MNCLLSNARLEEETLPSLQTIRHKKWRSNSVSSPSSIQRHHLGHIVLSQAVGEGVLIIVAMSAKRLRLVSSSLKYLPPSPTTSSLSCMTRSQPPCAFTSSYWALIRPGVSRCAGAQDRSGRPTYDWQGVVGFDGKPPVSLSQSTIFKFRERVAWTERSFI